MAIGSTSTCALCGDDMVTAYGGFDVPPRCLTLMQNSGGIDPDDVAGKVRVDLCEEDTEIARRMVEDYGTSPLPQCDADHVGYQTRDQVAAFAGEAPDDDGDGVTERMLEDALMAVRAEQTGDAAHIADHKLVEAKVVVLSLADLGVIDGDVVRDLKGD